ncbi:MAG: vWA domain-containing protein [Armatimonadota bacterium]
MHLLAPWWWLLLIPLAGVLIVLYLLKLRRRDYVVPTVFLWEQALQDLQSNVPFQKLRKNLLLLLQLLALILAIAALSRPTLDWVRRGGQSVVLVLDNSASMQSTDVGPSRFAAARKAAHQAIEGLGPRDSLMLVSVGGTTQALTPFTNDKRALHAAVDRLSPSDTRADLQGALLLAAGLVSDKKGREKPRIEIISDGAVPPLKQPDGMNLPIHFIKVGRRCENVGLIVMDARRRLSGAGFEGLVVLKNFGTSARTFPLELTLNGKLWDAREITLKPGQQHTEALQELPTDGSILAAKIDLPDDLAVDNEARLILPRLDPVPVLLVSPGNVFLRTALQLDPTVVVTERASVPTAAPAGTVLVVDNVPLPAVPAGVSALLIGKVGAALPGTARETASQPSIADWSRRHPVMEHIDLTGLQVSSSTVVDPAHDARVLIESQRGPVALSVERPGQRIVYLGWDLHRSDFPLRSSFPIFVANCIDWLSGQRQRAQLVNVHTGQILQVPLPAGTTKITLIPPDGRAREREVNGTLLTLDGLTRAGVYELRDGKTVRRFAANLLDATESDLTPRELQSRQGAPPVARGPVRTQREFWRGLLLLLVGLLCVEWWVFHRRVG